jgi:transposase InsO family protein
MMRAQGAGRAGAGPRAARHRLALAAPPPGPGLGRHHQPVPDPGRAGAPRAAHAARSSYIRFQAELPNERWQSDFTRYPFADGTGTEILT